MDWEKQDNELRKLMEGSDFLPESENWNGAEKWQSFTRKKRLLQGREIKHHWIWAVAACLVGMLGFTFYFRVVNPLQTTPLHLVLETKPEAKASENQSEAVPLQAGEIVLGSEKSAVPNASVLRVNPVNMNSVAGNKGLPKENMPNETPLTKHAPLTEEPISVVAAKTENQVSPVVTDAIGNMEAATPISNEPLVAVNSAKKPKIKVVHFNELHGKPPFTPPLFVQSKKEIQAMDGGPWQPLENRRDAFMSIRIDMSSSPKKSF